MTKISAGATPKTYKKEYWGGNIRWMNSGELNLKHVYEVEGRITKLGYESTSTKLLPKECVLIGLAGQGKTRGTCAINHIELCTNQSIGAIWPCKQIHSPFLYFNLDSRYKELRELSSGDGGRGGLNLPLIGNLKIPLCSISEQQKIATFLSLLEVRINTQNKIIEKYESLIKQINNNLFCGEDNSRIGDFIQEISKRNKDGAVTNVLSVSNKNGFVKQSEQFEEKELASENKTNYKIVQKGDFAFNPARINVGSIALLKNQEIGIVSPMYICFKPKNISDYILESYFLSSSFKKQMNKRLEGSVRMCLTIDGMRNIRFHNLNKKELDTLNILLKLRSFVFLNKKILNLYCLQKNYLLSNLFI